jgi:hypothetical protein
MSLSVSEIRRRSNKKLEEITKATNLFKRIQTRLESKRISFMQMLRLNRRVLDKYKIGGK